MVMDFLEGLGIVGPQQYGDSTKPTPYASPDAEVPSGATHHGNHQIPETGRPTQDSRGGSQGDPLNRRRRRMSRIPVPPVDPGNNLEQMPADVAAQRAGHEAQLNANEDEYLAAHANRNANLRKAVPGGLNWDETGPTPSGGVHDAPGFTPGEGQPNIRRAGHAHEQTVNDPAPRPSVPMPGFSDAEAPQETESGTLFGGPGSVPQPGFSSPETADKPKKSRATKRDTSPKVSFSDAPDDGTTGDYWSSVAADRPAPAPGFSSPSETATPRRSSAPAPGTAFSSAPGTDVSGTPSGPAPMPGFRAPEPPAPKGKPAAYGRAEKNGQGTLFPKAPYKGKRDEAVAPRLELSEPGPSGHVKGQGSLFGPGPYREPKAAPRAEARHTGRIDTEAAHQAPQGDTPNSGGRGATYVYNNYGTHYGSQHGDTYNGPGGTAGSSRDSGERAPVQPVRSPYGRGTRGQRAAYLLANTQINGQSANDLAHRYTGHQVEFNDQKTGKRIGDPHTDARKAGQAHEAGNYRQAETYRHDAVQHLQSQGVDPREARYQATRDGGEGHEAINQWGRNRRRERGGRREYHVNNGQYEEI